MSHKDEIKIEYKTIRIPALIYYKLVEITGMASAITGQDLSISEMAGQIIANFHHASYQQMINTMTNPTELQKMRDAMKGNTKQLADLFGNIKIRK